MSNVIKNPKNAKDPFILDSPTDSSGARKKVRKRNPDSLDFLKTISDEIASLNESFSRAARRQSDDRKKELDRIYNEAKSKGFQKGFDEALEKERSEKMIAVDMLLKDAKKKNKNAIRGLELKVIDLAVALAEQITRKTIDTYPEIVEDIIEETMAYLIGNETLMLRVSEHDFKIINNKYDKWLDLAGSAKEFRLEVDRRLKPGDCIIETEGGIIDAVVTNRLETLAEELIKVSS
ncbi:hypothetical protein LLG96_05185 [bacterium]|nr:hypothetical protein [bacterium]